MAPLATPASPDARSSSTLTAEWLATAVARSAVRIPSKVDRSASYAARWVAKNVVASGLASRCEVQLSYAIGKARPTSIYVNTFGTSKVPEEQISDAISHVFDLRPAAIVAELGMRAPIYSNFTCYGHFGVQRPGMAWEEPGLADKLADAVRG